MAIGKERLHELIEKIPREYYEEVEKELRKQLIPVTDLGTAPNVCYHIYRLFNTHSLLN